jgi:hypothetical protein
VGWWYGGCCTHQAERATLKEETAMGYIIAWLLGVPAAVLAVIWLINNS